MAGSDKVAVTKKQMPKGGRKGGTLFPRESLKQALEYAEKLVRKTHTGPQPEQTILPGVFGSSGATGKIRLSALKQYGLLEGESAAYNATKLAKEIEAAPPEERTPLLQSAFLNSKIFKQIFDTFHGDTVSKAKIRQTALSLKVHPDSADECVKLFIDSAETARLGKSNEDSITLVQANGLPTESHELIAKLPIDPVEPTEEEDNREGSGDDEANLEFGNAEEAKEESAKGAQSAKAGVTVNFSVDSSLDTDKLARQLALLRKFGVI